MKKALVNLVILICINLNICAQQTFTQPSWEKCGCCSLIDSLSKLNYFQKAKQIHHDKNPIDVNFSFSRYHGEFGIETEMFELVFSNNVGYMAYYNAPFLASDDHSYSINFHPRARVYTSITDINFVSDILADLNDFYVYDSTFVFPNPHPTYITGGGGATLCIKITFSNNEVIKNNLTFNRENTCFNYLKLNEYLEKLSYNNTKPNSLGIKESKDLLKKYHSEIAYTYLHDLYYSSPYLKTIEIERLDLNNQKILKIQPIKIIN